ncbi:hypothetical protein HMPREF1254_0051, partial [Prevotella sp. BV3P1]
MYKVYAKYYYLSNFVFSVQNETPEFKSILTFIRFY